MIGRIFLQGLKALTPLAITIAIVYWICAAVEHIFRAIVLWFLPAQYYFTGMGFFIGLIFVFFVGTVINAWIVDWAKGSFEKLINRIPLVKTLYRSSADLMSFFERPKDAGSRVVTFDYQGMRLIGIVTREHFSDTPEGMGENGEIAVYLPMSYQVGGYMVLVPRERVKSLDMTVEHAMRFVITAGMQGKPKEGI